MHQNSHTNTYLFPGLGADERLFQNIVFPDNMQVHCIVYPPPQKQQTIAQYAQLLSEQITTKDNCFLGCSIGGILSIEVAKIIAPKKLVLVSTVKTYREIPLHFRILKHFPLYKLIPINILKTLGGLGSKIGGKHEKGHLQLLSTMLQETDNNLIKWGIQQICHWRNEDVPLPYVHIHGSWDLIFPIYKINNTIAVPKAAHFSLLLQYPELLDSSLRSG